MNDTQPNGDIERLAQLDRLATGELAASARRELFAWLEGDRSRWRRCALVLLEARELEHAFDEFSTKAPQAFVPATRPSTFALSAWCGWGGRLALAASLLFAFGLGVAVQRIRNATRPSDRSAVTETRRRRENLCVAAGQSGANRGGRSPCFPARQPSRRAADCSRRFLGPKPRSAPGICSESIGKTRLPRRITAR